MNDDAPDIVPGQVAITDSRGNILNKGPREKPGKRTRPPADFMKGYVTREEVIEHMTTASLEIGNKMYEQMSGEIAEDLEAREKAITRHIIEYFEERTIRGKIKRFIGRFRPKTAPALVVDAVDVLDPNVEKPTTIDGLKVHAEVSGYESKHLDETMSKLEADTDTSEL